MGGQDCGIVQKLSQDRIDFVELWFVDLFGRVHSLGVPSHSLDEDAIRYGLDKLDSSSIRGFGSVNDSEIRMVPDISTYRLLPPEYDARGRRNARMFANLYCGGLRGDEMPRRHERDSRAVCSGAADELAREGLEGRWGPEIEFFVFDGVLGPDMIDHAWRRRGMVGYRIESGELGAWKGAESSPKAGYCKAPPGDTVGDFRRDVCERLYRYFGIRVEAHHHEVATAGQCEINIEYGRALEIADGVVTIKNLARVVAAAQNRVATFMPKPFYGDNASAMHMHQSLWGKDGRNVMHDPADRAGLSQLARYYIGGILDHVGALCALSNPTTNSYKRLVPGYEAPTCGCWGVGNRSAAIRIPGAGGGGNRKRIEFRVSDAASNPYLLEAALTMAGLDGIRKKTDPGDPVEENVYHMSAERRRMHSIRQLPATLRDSLDALQSDRGFLRGVFSPGLLDSYVSIKYLESDEFSQTPTAWEIATYLDV